MNKLEQFFYEHAGVSYFPDRETKEEGRQRHAKALAAAYTDAIMRGYHFNWVASDVGWACRLSGPNERDIASLWEIDVSNLFDPYCRVVEAELALQELS